MVLYLAHFALCAANLEVFFDHALLGPSEHYSSLIAE